MEEQIISFRTAKLAKEKGFDIHTHDLFYDSNEFLSICHSSSHNSEKCKDINEPECYAPNQALLQQWLREKHNIHIEIHSFETMQFPNKYKAEIFDVDSGSDRVVSKLDVTIGYLTYEEALEDGLYKSLQFIF